MTVSQHLPCEALRAYVRAVLLVESDAGHLSQVLPDTGLSLVFRYGGSIRLAADGPEAPLPEAVLTGIRKTAAAIRYTPETRSCIVLFREGGAAAFLKHPAHLFFNSSVALTDVAPPQQVEEVLGRLREAADAAGRLRVVETFLLAQLRPAAPDPLVAAAIHAIEAAHGQGSTALLAKTLYSSQDAFEKRFRRVTGTTPKHFARIVRLRYALRLLSTSRSLTDAAHAAAYFDQAHFSRDVRLLIGAAPSELLKKAFW